MTNRGWRIDGDQIIAPMSDGSPEEMVVCEPLGSTVEDAKYHAALIVAAVNSYTGPMDKQ